MTVVKLASYILIYFWWGKNDPSTHFLNTFEYFKNCKIKNPKVFLTINMIQT